MSNFTRPSSRIFNRSDWQSSWFLMLTRFMISKAFKGFSRRAVRIFSRSVMRVPYVWSFGHSAKIGPNKGHEIFRKLRDQFIADDQKNISPRVHGLQDFESCVPFFHRAQFLPLPLSDGCMGSPPNSFLKTSACSSSANMNT